MLLLSQTSLCCALCSNPLKIRLKEKISRALHVFIQYQAISLKTQRQTELRKCSVKSPFVGLAWSDNPQTLIPLRYMGYPPLPYFYSILAHSQHTLHLTCTSSWLWLPFHTHSCLPFLNHKKKTLQDKFMLFRGSFAHLSTLYEEPCHVYCPGNAALAERRAGIGWR